MIPNYTVKTDNRWRIMIPNCTVNNSELEISGCNVLMNTTHCQWIMIWTNNDEGQDPLRP